jgi:hypothetical protein
MFFETTKTGFKMRPTLAAIVRKVVDESDESAS